MRNKLNQLVKERAFHCCEYCLLPDSFEVRAFQIDHIIAEQHGGLTIETNLAYCCPGCNNNKGPNIAGLDPDRAEIIPVLLFNPRKERWKDHFNLHGSHIIGTTPSGRVTVYV